jgi:hypothetical protein
MPHRNAPPGETGRLRLARCVVGRLAGAAVHGALPGLCHHCGTLGGALPAAGMAAMADRSSRPRTSPSRTRCVPSAGG